MECRPVAVSSIAGVLVVLRLSFLTMRRDQVHVGSRIFCCCMPNGYNTRLSGDAAGAKRQRQGAKPRSSVRTSCYSLGLLTNLRTVHGPLAACFVLGLHDEPELLRPPRPRRRPRARRHATARWPPHLSFRAMRCCRGGSGGRFHDREHVSLGPCALRAPAALRLGQPEREALYGCARFWGIAGVGRLRRFTDPR